MGTNLLCVPQLLDQNLYHIKSAPPKLQLQSKTLTALSCRYCSPSQSVSIIVKQVTSSKLVYDSSTFNEVYIYRAIALHFVTHVKSIFDFFVCCWLDIEIEKTKAKENVIVGFALIR